MPGHVNIISGHVLSESGHVYVMSGHVTLESGHISTVRVRDFDLGAFDLEVGARL